MRASSTVRYSHADASATTLLGVITLVSELEVGIGRTCTIQVSGCLLAFSKKKKPINMCPLWRHSISLHPGPAFSFTFIRLLPPFRLALHISRCLLLLPFEFRCSLHASPLVLTPTAGYCVKTGDDDFRLTTGSPPSSEADEFFVLSYGLPGLSGPSLNHLPTNLVLSFLSSSSWISGVSTNPTFP